LSKLIKMFTRKFFPAFADTDALGHINNTTYPYWFENSRSDLFEIFTPGLDPKNWKLILARMEIDFIAQGDFGKTVEIQTSIEKIGNSSFTVLQVAIQDKKEIARGKCIMVHFDYKIQKAIPLTDFQRGELSKHYLA
jgi:acyl-CoA thioester hydrolase